MIDGVCLLPYSEKLQIFTTLIERCNRGDLIEVFKANKGFSDISGVFSFGRSGSNLISSMNSYSGSPQFIIMKRNFVNECTIILELWN